MKHFVDLWKSDGYIEELDGTHCLIYNKFAEAERHLLVVTKYQENQTDPLNTEDFRAALKV